MMGEVVGSDEQILKTQYDDAVAVGVWGHAGTILRISFKTVH